MSLSTALCKEGGALADWPNNLSHWLRAQVSHRRQQRTRSEYLTVEKRLPRHER